MLRRHPVFSFYLVVFALTLFSSWLTFFVFHGDLSMEWIAVCSPAMAALLLTALVDGKAGIVDLLARLARWKVHWKWYLAIFLLPVLFAMGFAFADTLLDGRGLAAGWNNLAGLALAMLHSAPGLLLMTLLMGVLIAGEELGWRGFALDRLLKTRGPIAASLIVGFFWGIWHIPSVLDPTSVLNKAPLAYGIPLFIIGTIVFSFVYTWLWQNTRGSLLIICLFHSFYNMTDYFTAALFPSFYMRFWLYLLVMVIILLPVWLLRPHPTKKESPSLASLP